MANHKLQPDNWVDLYADYLFNYAVSRVSDAEIAKDLTICAPIAIRNMCSALSTVTGRKT